MRTRGALLALTLWSCSSLSAVGVRGGIAAEEVAKLPPRELESYELFAKKCSRCHSLARPLTAQIEGPAHWRLYVTRMRRQPGSGISPADAEQILVFLEYYAAQKNAGLVDVNTSSVAIGGER